MGVLVEGGVGRREWGVGCRIREKRNFFKKLNFFR